MFSGTQHKSSQWLPLTENISSKKSTVIDFSFIWLNNLKFSEHRTSILFHLKYSICHPLDSTNKSSHTTSLCSPLPPPWKEVFHNFLPHGNSKLVKEEHSGLIFYIIFLLFLRKFHNGAFVNDMIIFKSLCRDHIFRLGFSMVFLSPSRQMLG